MKILLLSDNPLDFNGGAEANDAELVTLLGCDFCQTKDFTKSDHDLYILSNHFHISKYSIDFLKDKRKIHIAHDYLFCHSRNPLQFYNAIVPEDFQRNREFLLSCDKIIVHSKLQEDIWARNGFNTINFEGNLWKESDLKLIENLQSVSKNGRAFILQSEVLSKGQEVSEEFCRNFKLSYDLIPRMGYENLITNMARYSLFVFFPNSPETFSRTTAEAKMLNCSVATNNLVGFSYSEEYNLNGETLIKKMKTKKEELISLLLD